MAEYRELHRDSMGELTVIGEEFGYPLMLKSKTQAYHGRGNYRIQTQADISPALEALKGRPLYAEKWVTFWMELAVFVVKKTKDGVLSLPTVEMIQEDSIRKLVCAPARNISDTISAKAQELARNAVAAFEGKVSSESKPFFFREDDTLLICELACRTHNSGHWTIEAYSLSQLDTLLRAILDLPIPLQCFEFRQPAVVLNMLGGSTPDFHLKVAKRALSVPNAGIHLYSKGAAPLGWKMGHITITAPTMHQAETVIQPLIDSMNDICVQCTNVLFQRPSPQTSVASSKSPPTIGVMMGSNSDLKTLIPSLKPLKHEFRLKPGVDIISAHRTPTYMAEYASTAASHGIKIVIAAAKGAAHFPGMVAAYISLLVGLAVEGSTLSGIDSLYSIVQMPRGVPFATVRNR